MDHDVAFAIALRAVDDPTFRLRLAADMEGVLKEYGIQEPRLREDLIRVIAALLRTEYSSLASYQEQHDTTLQTADSFKSGLRDTINRIERGFHVTMIMYTVAFYLGAAMILAAIAMAWVQERSLLPITFAVLGIIDIVAYFITRPPQDLQFSRARLAQLQAAFFNWFIDYTNWNGVLMAWIQEGRADLQSVKAVSAILMEHTEKTMSLIESYCSPARTAEKTPPHG